MSMKALAPSLTLTSLATVRQPATLLTFEVGMFCFYRPATAFTSTWTRGRFAENLFLFFLLVVRGCMNYFLRIHIPSFIILPA